MIFLAAPAFTTVCNSLLVCLPVHLVDLFVYLLWSFNHLTSSQGFPLALLTVSSTFVLLMTPFFILYNWWHGLIPEELCFYGMPSSSLILLLFITTVSTSLGLYPQGWSPVMIPIFTNLICDSLQKLKWVKADYAFSKKCNLIVVAALSMSGGLELHDLETLFQLNPFCE